MTPLSITLLAVGMSVGYGLAAGATWALLAPLDHDDARILGTVFWPFALPFALGMRLVARLQRPSLPKATARPSPERAL